MVLVHLTSNPVLQARKHSQKVEYLKNHQTLMFGPHACHDRKNTGQMKQHTATTICVLHFTKLIQIAHQANQTLLRLSFLDGVESLNGGFWPHEGLGLARISGLLVDGLITLAKRSFC